MTKRILGVAIVPHWLAFVVALAFTLEYARIVFLTEAPGSKSLVLGFWALLLVVSIVALVVARKRRVDGAREKRNS